MNDEQFLAELTINAYCNQISGCPVGHTSRLNFEPTVPLIEEGNGINRERTLELPAYTFTPEEKAALLK